MDMKNSYVAIYNENAAFFYARPKYKRALLIFNRFTPYAFALAYALLLGYAAFNLFANELSALLFSPACALLIVSVLQAFVDRPRPYAAEGANVIPLAEKRGNSQSFPSRHLASAAAISVCFFPYLPIVGGVLLLLTLGLGYTRFAIGWHYPSDLITGFLLGLACGALLFLF